MTPIIANNDKIEGGFAHDKRVRRQRLKGRGGENSSLSDSKIRPLYARLFIGGLVLFLFYYDAINPNHKQPLTLLLASSVFIVGCLPMLYFLWRGRTFQVPLVESHAMFYVVCFGWAGFLPIPALSAAMTVTENGIQTALAYTLIGLLALLFGYYVIGNPLFRKIQPIHYAQFPNSSFEYIGWAGCVTGYAMVWLSRHHSIGALGQIGSMINSLGLFLLLVLAFEGKIALLARVAVILVLLPMTLLMQSGLSSGQLAGAVTMVCWIGLIMLRAWRRVPILLFAGGFVFFIIFQPVKFYVRNIAWGEGIQMGPWQTLQAYGRGFLETYGSSSKLMANRGDAFQSSFTRINHLATTASIISDTPSLQPFLHGESYYPLFTKWIPRALWPGKPQERFGNDWARRYGYLGENDTTTSFNLPWLPEMYMNFGLAGIIGMMFLLGVLYRFIWKRIMEYPESALEYAIAIMFAHALVFVESNFSLLFGGVIVLSILLWIMTRFLGLFYSKSNRA